MCILMYFGPGAQPIEKHLENGCRNNPDGFGYAVIDNAGENILTGHSMDHDALIAEFLTVRAEHSVNTAIFHARITTDGTSTLDNCHPFKVRNNPGIVLGHNGILPCRPGKDDSRSDTRILAEDIMMRRFPALDSPKTKRRFESWLGAGSKVVILTTEERYQRQAYIFNERLGFWLEDAEKEGREGDYWYSNSSHELYRWSSGYMGGYSWPKTIGSPRKDMYTETGTGYGKSYTGYSLACKNCGYIVSACECAGPLETSWLPSSVVRRRDDKGREVYTCGVCESLASVDAVSAKCRVCDYMYCCDQPEAACLCWGEDGAGITDADLDELFTDRLEQVEAASVERTIPALSSKPHDAEVS